jgi:hypothetical protein
VQSFNKGDEGIVGCEATVRDSYMYLI